MGKTAVLSLTNRGKVFAKVTLLNGGDRVHNLAAEILKLVPSAGHWSDLVSEEHLAQRFSLTCSDAGVDFDGMVIQIVNGQDSVVSFSSFDTSDENQFENLAKVWDENEAYEVMLRSFYNATFCGVEVDGVAEYSYEIRYRKSADKPEVFEWEGVQRNRRCI